MSDTIPKSGTFVMNIGFLYSQKFGTTELATDIIEKTKITFRNNNLLSYTDNNGNSHDISYNDSWGLNGEKQIILSAGVNIYIVLSDPSYDLSYNTYQNNSGVPVYNYTNNKWLVNTRDKNGDTIQKVFTTNSKLEADGDWTVCFLPGTEISTGGLTRRVEELVAGDLIDVLVNGQTQQKTVSWVGRSHCVIKPSRPDDEAGYPVRILKDALAENVPFKDMLITAEHCLFFEGCFVPARMLVNDRSIFFDKSFTSYDYYHVETEDHSVITADGVLTESYLDTGNRRAFQQDGSVFSLFGGRSLTWADHAAAPLNVSRDFVEPLFQAINARAEATGITTRTDAPVLTNNPDLYLRTTAGTVFRPVRSKGDCVLFMIPENVETLYIVSNSSRPCDVAGPFVDDRRQLGVLIGEVKLFMSETTRSLTDHLCDDGLSGWHAREASAVRWTDGCARLDLGDRGYNSLAMLSLQILAAGPYPVTQTIIDQDLLQA